MLDASRPAVSGPVRVLAATLLTGVFRVLSMTCAAACVVAAVPGAARAQADSLAMQAYVGGTFGAVHGSASHSLGAGSAITREVENAMGGHVFGGARFGRHVGFEMARLQFGELGYEARTPGGPVDAARNIGMTTLNVAGFLPLGTRWELTARAGIALDASYTTGETCYQRSNSLGQLRSYPCRRTSYVLGAGVRYGLNDHWGLRVEYLFVQFRDSRDGPDYRPHFVGVGLDYRF
ncbi:MAG: porin family protein [Betaproteobacteria bacterium]